MQIIRVVLKMQRRNRCVPERHIKIRTNNTKKPEERLIHNQHTNNTQNERKKKETHLHRHITNNYKQTECKERPRRPVEITHEVDDNIEEHDPREQEWEVGEGVAEGYGGGAVESVGGLFIED